MLHLFFWVLHVYSQGRRKDVSRLASRHVADVLGYCSGKVGEVGVSWPIFGQNHAPGIKRKSSQLLKSGIGEDLVFENTRTCTA